MTHPTELDLGPLAWVKSEIDLALARAAEALEQAANAAEGAASVQFAQTHLHQARGALAIVGLDGLTQFTVALDQLLGALARGERPIEGATLALAQRALAAIGNYLEELSLGAADQPLRLAALHAGLVAARGAAEPSPAELFFPDLSLRPPRRPDEPPALSEDQRQQALRAHRARFERGLLGWLRSPSAAEHVQTMREAVAGIEALQPNAAQRALWWASLAFVDTLADNGSGDAAARQMCAQLNTQMRRLQGGAPVSVPDRLMREVLYRVATAPASTEQQRAVRATWRLDSLLPEPGAAVSEVPLAPLLQGLRTTLAATKDAWNAFSDGTAAALPRFEQELTALCAQARKLGRPAFDRLLGGLAEFAQWLRKDPLRADDTVAIEVATALLLGEAALDHGIPAGGFADQVADTLSRLAALMRGEAIEPAESSPTVEVARRAQEREAVGQLAREIHSSLAHIEQVLDDYFRDQGKRAQLTTVAEPLKQIEGALTLLGETEALDLVHQAAQEIAGFAERAEPPERSSFEALAHRLSALGFYVDSLRHGHETLDHFLHPDAPRPAPAADEETAPELATVRAAEPPMAAAAPPASDESPSAAPAEAAAAPGNEAVASVPEPIELDVFEPEPPPPPPAVPEPAPQTRKLIEEASAEEIDAELLAIFIEEAHEVLATIGENLELSRTEPANTEYLTAIRRGFHTLKGSGRMVGLRDLGEAAWGMEQTLNRWLQLEWQPTPALHHLVDAAHQLFGQWVTQLESGGPHGFDAGALMAEAERLRSSEQALSDPTPLAEPAPPQPGDGVLPPAVLETSLDLPDLAMSELGEVLPYGFREQGDSFLPAETALEETSLEVFSLDALLDDSAPDDATLAEPAPQQAAPAEAAPAEFLLADDVAAEGPPASAAPALPPTAGAPEEGDEADEAAAAAPEPETLASEPFAVGELVVDDLDSFGEDAAPPVTPAIAGDAADEQRSIPSLDDALPSQAAEDSDAAAADGEADLLDELARVLPDADADDDGLGIGLAFDEDAPIALDGVELTEIPLPDFDFGDLMPPAGPAADAEPFAVAPPSAEPAAGETRHDDAATAQEAAAPEADDHPAVAEAALETDDISAVAEAALEADDISAIAEAAPLTDEIAATDDAETPAPAPAAATPAAPREPPAEADADFVRVGDTEISRPLYDLYRGEARHHIATLHAEFSRLQANPTLLPPEPAVRAAHTLAGISGTARLAPVQHLARALEHAQERLREIAQPPGAEQSALLKTSADTLEAMLAEIGERRMPLDVPELAEQLEGVGRSPAVDAAPQPALAPAAGPMPGTGAEGAEAVAAPVHDDIDAQLLPIFLDEAAELLAQLDATLRAWRDAPDDPDHAHAAARLLHTLKGSARMAGAMTLGEHVHQMESRLEAFARDGKALAALIDELQAGLDLTSQLLDGLAGGEAPAAPAAPAATGTEPSAEAEAAGGAPTLRVRADAIDRFVNEAGEIGIARTRIEGEMRTLRRSLLDLTENVIRLRNQLREVEIQAEVQMQSRMAQAESHHAEFDPLEMDRYTRLQELTRMMAESVNDVTTVQQNLLKNLDAADVALHGQARMSRDLQQALMQVRMVPFDSLADRLYRIVRQSAKELGKRANLDMRGGRIEIDRSLLERIVAPLEHLLRNAIAHGIETPEARRAAGKPELGQITLAVRQEGNEIAIELTDDGAGLDFARIAARARANGLLGADETADERRLTNLIFVPGFSTAGAVSAVSGRGVGMDVVKSETAAVGGRLDVHSTPGAGTVFRIYLPLTLAVTQALLVRAGGRSYAIPSSMIAQVLELKTPALEALRTAGGTDWQGERFAYRYLPRLLGDYASQPEMQRFNWVLLLRAGAQTLALHVDALRGNQEIVVKNAGPQLARLVGVSGATVLGDGEIVLILNPVALASRNLGDEQAAAAGAQPPSAPAVVHTPTVMVVDDSLTVRKITGRLLEREGYRVITAKDGVDALEKLLQIVPDVILSDIEMPRMDGFDLVRNVRADERLEHVPIVMITSRLADKHRRYAEEVGANHYLGKPFQEEALLELLKTYADRAAASAA